LQIITNNFDVIEYLFSMAFLYKICPAAYKYRQGVHQEAEISIMYKSNSTIIKTSNL